MKKLIFSLLLGAATLGFSPLVAMDNTDDEINSPILASKHHNTQGPVDATFFEPNKIVSFRLNYHNLPLDSMGNRDIRPALNLGRCFLSGREIDFSTASTRDTSLDYKIIITNQTNKLNALIAQDPSLANYIMPGW